MIVELLRTLNLELLFYVFLHDSVILTQVLGSLFPNSLLSNKFKMKTILVAFRIVFNEQTFQCFYDIDSPES